MVVTLFQCGKLNFWSTRPKTDVLYMFYTKFHLPRPIFYSPSSKCTYIGERASVSLPHCYFGVYIPLEELRNMEVSMLSRTWLTITQHVFQPALTGRPELIYQKIVSSEPGTKAIAVSRFHEILSPANWVQGVTAISRKISHSWAPKKLGSNMRPRYIQFRDIHHHDISGVHCIRIPITMIRRSQNHLNFGMGIPIPEKTAILR